MTGTGIYGCGVRLFSYRVMKVIMVIIEIISKTKERRKSVRRIRRKGYLQERKKERITKEEKVKNKVVWRIEGKLARRADEKRNEA